MSQAPFVFTFSVCGSMKTLDFLRWLGVDVPRWIENDLKHAADPLEASYQQAFTTATELMAYCRTLGVPFGINRRKRVDQARGNRSLGAPRRTASKTTRALTRLALSKERSAPP